MFGDIHLYYLSLKTTLRSNFPPLKGTFFSVFFLFSADGNFEVTLATKATLNYTGELLRRLHHPQQLTKLLFSFFIFAGRVDWHPPAIYKSSCEIDVGMKNHFSLRQLSHVFMLFSSPQFYSQNIFRLTSRLAL